MGRLGRQWPYLLLALLAAGSVVRSLPNGFAVDDYPIIVENPEVHHLSAPWTYAQQSFWPPNDLGDLYRPLTVIGFALQWAVGDGDPMAFRIGTIVLTAACSILVFLLARTLVPVGPAFAGAAIFAVHPVHVEATGNNVGQAELWMASLVLVACLFYVHRRGAVAQGLGGLGFRANLTLAGLLVLAAAAKEQGLTLLGLLGAIELIAFRDAPLRERMTRLAPTFRILSLTAVAFVLWRFLILGDLGGGRPAAGLAGVGLVDRTSVMIPLFLHWLRLAIWPAHLRAIYSVPEFGGPPTVPALLGGALAIVALVAVLVWSRKRSPAICLGIVWFATASVLTSNLLFPTAFLIAERTFTLPSVGLALVAGGAVALLKGAARPVAGIAVAMRSPGLGRRQSPEPPRSATPAASLGSLGLTAHLPRQNGRERWNPPEPSPTSRSPGTP